MTQSARPFSRGNFARNVSPRALVRLLERKWSLRSGQPVTSGRYEQPFGLKGILRHTLGHDHTRLMFGTHVSVTSDHELGEAVDNAVEAGMRRSFRTHERATVVSGTLD